MIKLFSLKQQKAAEEAAAAEGKTKSSPGQIRMLKGSCSRGRGCILSQGESAELTAPAGPHPVCRSKRADAQQRGVYHLPQRQG